MREGRQPSHLRAAGLPPEDLPLNLLGPLRPLPAGLADQVAAEVQAYLSNADYGVGVLVDECEDVVHLVEVCLFRVHADGWVEPKRPASRRATVDGRA